MLLPQRLLLACLLGLLSACGSSGSSSSSGDSGSGGSTPNLTFSFGSTSVEEDHTTRYVEIRLDKVHHEDVDVSFLLGGNAYQLVDYWLPKGMPVTISDGERIAFIEVQIWEDEGGELDETIEMTLMKPFNAKLGGQTTHVVTISDDDAIPVEEVEPNDDYLTAQLLGSVEGGVSREIQGEALLGNMDVYGFQALENTTVFVSMDPAMALSEVVIELLDENGDVVDIFDDDIEGTVSTYFEMSAQETRFLAVTVEAFDSTYVLDIVGL